MIEDPRPEHTVAPRDQTREWECLDENTLDGIEPGPVEDFPDVETGRIWRSVATGRPDHERGLGDAVAERSGVNRGPRVPDHVPVRAGVETLQLGGDRSGVIVSSQRPLDHRVVKVLGRRSEIERDDAAGAKQASATGLDEDPERLREHVRRILDLSLSLRCRRIHRSSRSAAGYLPVDFGLFCLGFLGFFAFLSMPFASN